MDVTDRVSRRQALLTALLAPFAGRLPSFSGLSSETFDLPISAPRAIPMYTEMISLPVTDEMIEDYDRGFRERINMRLSIMLKQGKGLTQAEQAYLDSLPPPEPVPDNDPYHHYLRVMSGDYDPYIEEDDE